MLLVRPAAGWIYLVTIVGQSVVSLDSGDSLNIAVVDVTSRHGSKVVDFASVPAAPSSILHPSEI